MIRKVAVLVIWVVVNCSGVLGQKVGMSSMQFLKIMPSARISSLGDASVALSSGSEAIFFNPASLTEINGEDMTFNYVDWFMDTYLSAISFGWGISRFSAIGMKLIYNDMGKFEETTVDMLGFVETDGGGYYNPGITGREFSARSYLIGLSYAQRLTDKFSFGLTVNYIYESLYSAKEVKVGDKIYKTYTSSVVFDFGMRYITGFRSVVIGASVQNFGPDVKFAEEGYPPPMMFRAGVAFNLLGSTSLLFMGGDNLRLTVLFDMFQPNDYMQQFHTGFEFSYKEVLSLRVGKKFNYDVESWSYGIGLNFVTKKIDVRFDYSYSPFGVYLGDVQKLTLGIGLK